MNDFSKLIPRGALSSRRRLRALSEAIDIRDLEDRPHKPEPVVRPVTRAGWHRTVLSIHKAVCR